MILIRADANEHIGTGHVMRCLSVAGAFVNKGEKVLFVTADHRGDKLINQQGFDTVSLDSEWTDMESEGVDKVVKKYKPNLVLVDSYYVTEHYLDSLRDIIHTAYFDDLNIKRWNVDYLINYNIFAEVFDYSQYRRIKTKLLLTPRYAPLRDEFRNCPEHKITKVSDIMVTAGGADPEHITERIMSGICPVMRDIVFHFIVGALNPRLSDIKNLAEGKENIVLHINERHMSDLMEKCDLAISAAGTTLYELCAMGIPTIAYTLADNQMVAAEQFAKHGIMLSAGDCRGDDGFIGRIEELLRRIIDDNELRYKLSTRMQKLVDGKGAERIVDALQ